jgi:hypothetical protein
MRQVNEQQYKQFTSKERLNLTIAALSRGDESEANKLWQTCPRYQYQAHDFEYTLSVSALMLLNALFFEKCVSHYNLIMKADSYAMGFEQDLEFEEAEEYSESSKQAQGILDKIINAKNIHVAQLKGLFEGFRQFCSEAGLDSECLLKAIPVNDYCHDLNMLLATDIQTDIQYTSKIKSFFLEHWNF